MNVVLCPSCGTSRVNQEHEPFRGGEMFPDGRRYYSCDRGCEQNDEGAPLSFTKEDGMAAADDAARITAKVNSILQEMVGQGDVLPTDKLRDQLQLDAIDFVELALDLEEAFEIDVPDGYEDDLVTVADLHRWATEHAWRRP